ncbi:MAG TPA: hypothetical protein PLY47_13180, partial [Rhodoglobus sp.]|nr:hypothetical protein [Rhodoglobus sp.]
RRRQVLELHSVTGWGLCISGAVSRRGEVRDESDHEHDAQGHSDGAGNDASNAQASSGSALEANNAENDRKRSSDEANYDRENDGYDPGC